MLLQTCCYGIYLRDCYSSITNGCHCMHAHFVFWVSNAAFSGLQNLYSRQGSVLNEQPCCPASMLSMQSFMNDVLHQMPVVHSTLPCLEESLSPAWCQVWQVHALRKIAWGCCLAVPMQSHFSNNLGGLRKCMMQWACYLLTGAGGLAVEHKVLCECEQQLSDVSLHRRE